MGGKIYVIGLGPGGREQMTGRALGAIAECQVLAGYKVYMEQISSLTGGKEMISKGMGEEIERCQAGIQKALEGNTVGIVCSGDGGLYGMAGLLLELIPKEEQDFIEVEIIPGVTAALAASALLGSPITEDFCTISLSDYMVSWERIRHRLECAAEADFTIALYNPRSKARPEYLREAAEVIQSRRLPQTPVGIVRNAYRQEQKIIRTTLYEMPYEEVDMFCTVIIGNSRSEWLGPWMLTPRGYALPEKEK